LAEQNREIDSGITSHGEQHKNHSSFSEVTIDLITNIIIQVKILERGGRMEAVSPYQIHWDMVANRPKLKVPDKDYECG
jgi:hypothetical protein